jgi:hypothetical protein
MWSSLGQPILGRGMRQIKNFPASFNSTVKSTPLYSLAGKSSGYSYHFLIRQVCIPPASWEHCEALSMIAWNARVATYNITSLVFLLSAGTTPAAASSPILEFSQTDAFAPPCSAAFLSPLCASLTLPSLGCWRPCHRWFRKYKTDSPYSPKHTLV